MKFHKGRVEREYKKLEDFFDATNGDIKKWIDDNIKTGKIEKLENVFGGLKSKNIFLRDIGKFEFVPIDVHEKRFLMRTGIFEYYLGRKIKDGANEILISDLFDDKQVEMVLKQFSRDFMRGEEIEGYELDKNPGIVDMFIWYHCAKGKKENERNIGGVNICGKYPHCGKCPLKYVCLTGKRKDS